MLPYWTSPLELIVVDNFENFLRVFTFHILLIVYLNKKTIFKEIHGVVDELDDIQKAITEAMKEVHVDTEDTVSLHVSTSILLFYSDSSC